MKTKDESDYLKIGDTFIGKLKNQYKDHILFITEEMLDDDENTLMFIHYNGFEKTEKLNIGKTTTKEQLEYWKQRCLAAELYIEESPCDPDIYQTQNDAYWKWKDIVNKQSEYDSI